MERLFSWEVLGWVVAFFVPMAVGLIGLREHLLAKWCFAISGLVLAGRTAMWVRPLDSPWRYPLAFVAFGLIGVSVVESIRWVEKKGSEAGAPNSPTPTTAAPAAVDRTVATGTPTPLRPDVVPSPARSRTQSAAVARDPGLPLIAIEFHDHGLFVHNLVGSRRIIFYGLSSRPERDARELLPGFHYHILINDLEQRCVAILGQNGEKRETVEAYFADERDRHYVVSMIWWMRTVNGVPLIECQQLKTERKTWR